MENQFEQVIIGKSAGARTGVARTQGEKNAAARSGAVVGTEKKYANVNANHKDTEGQKLAKIDRDDEPAPPKKLEPEIGKTIAKARMDKGLKQADLAKTVNEKATVINDYEQARAIPSQAVLGKLERALGVKLRGKDIGMPLGGPKK
ncbi:multi protein bridging factor 1-domain-containing protein [Protomyces lactucae-debilis]|uniref:Multi protein bridging factor 1-domain-containing protein n=1 Tax=Protomyces lactucae-debilis TaxID=2754530 RepID=A0A1Y2FR01_PROLT|nr:multi protein bridging factor 1-domain-containing protein [Protomyces lactucae-debilis]ORY86398.1 multi protein bridging factor 1-domain-containing protein [Protomyces lactucae-debilis]